MNSGTIKHINLRKGFGFITPEGKDGKNKENNIFFHTSRVVEPAFEKLKVADKVDYIETDTEKGPEAVDVVAYQK